MAKASSKTIFYLLPNLLQFLENMNKEMSLPNRQACFTSADLPVLFSKPVQL